MGVLTDEAKSDMDDAVTELTCMTCSLEEILDAMEPLSERLWEAMKLAGREAIDPQTARIFMQHSNMCVYLKNFIKDTTSSAEKLKGTCNTRMEEVDESFYKEYERLLEDIPQHNVVAAVDNSG